MLCVKCSLFMFLILRQFFISTAAGLLCMAKSNGNTNMSIAEQPTLVKHEAMPILLRYLRPRSLNEKSSLLLDLQSTQSHANRNKPLADVSPKSHQQHQEHHFVYLKGLRDGLLLVAATVVVYLLICLVVSLFVLWLSKRYAQDDQMDLVAVSHVTENSVLMQTPSNVLSHR